MNKKHPRENMQTAYQNYVAWRLNSKRTDNSFLFFAEMILINPEAFDSWECGFTRLDVLDILKMHYNEYIDINIFPWKLLKHGK